MLRKTLLAACLGFSHWLSAATYNLPTDGSNMVGTLQYHSVVVGETMSDIAKQYDVGFLSLMAANKGVDPFLPKEGYVLTIPSQAILPHVDYKAS